MGSEMCIRDRVVPAPAARPRPSRALGRAVAPVVAADADAAAEAGRRRRTRRGEERVVRTPIDLDEVRTPARAERRTARFRDDLVNPAARNGAAERPAPEAEPAPDATDPGPARRRRSEPLRAR